MKLEIFEKIGVTFERRYTMQTKNMMVGFLLLIVLFFASNSPLFSLTEYQSLQMEQEIIKRVFDTNRDLGYSCVVTGCSRKESNGVITVEVNWITEEGRRWIGRSLFFSISEVYYGSNIRQKFVIYTPILFQKNIFYQPVHLKDDGHINGVEYHPLESVYIEVPGGGGSGHNVSIDDPPSIRGLAMLMRDIPVVVVDYRPLLEYNPDTGRPTEPINRIAFIWDQYEDLIRALKKIKEMGFEVVGTFGHSYGAYLCSVVEAKNPGVQGRLFLGAGIYDVSNLSIYWFHWFGVYQPGEDLLNEWSPGSTDFVGDNVFIACPIFDSSVSPTHSFWLKDKWPKAFLKEYQAGHDFFEVYNELLGDIINWILFQESDSLASCPPVY
ncbi:MAG: hypothetical protein NT166_32565 [Candidatus Aminicenantes bacterium]|nr:hypothetical protein [Candidatus Aminicenantes bacterium]